MRTRQTIGTLNRLIRTCRDVEQLCRMCAGAAAGPELGSLLHYRSEEWGRLGDELQALVLLLDGAPAVSGTPGACARQTWLMARLRALGSDDLMLVSEWQRAQRSALDRYDEALNGYLPERIRRTLGLQAQRIAERCDQTGMVQGRHAMHSQGA